jgi:hypothetical protein
VSEGAGLGLPQNHFDHCMIDKICMIKLHMQYTQKNALTTSNEKKFLNHTHNALKQHQKSQHSTPKGNTALHQ